LSFDLLSRFVDFDLITCRHLSLTLPFSALHLLTFDLPFWLFCVLRARDTIRSVALHFDVTFTEFDYAGQQTIASRFVRSFRRFALLGVQPRFCISFDSFVYNVTTAV